MTWGLGTAAGPAGPAGSGTAAGPAVGAAIKCGGGFRSWKAGAASPPSKGSDA